MVGKNQWLYIVAYGKFPMHGERNGIQNFEVFLNSTVYCCHNPVIAYIQYHLPVFCNCLFSFPRVVGY